MNYVTIFEGDWQSFRTTPLNPYRVDFADHFLNFTLVVVTLESFSSSYISKRGTGVKLLKFQTLFLGDTNTNIVYLLGLVLHGTSNPERHGVTFLRVFLQNLTRPLFENLKIHPNSRVVNVNSSRRNGSLIFSIPSLTSLNYTLKE